MSFLMEWLGGASGAPTKINFETVQEAIKSPNRFWIINTLTIEEQYCLIKTTLTASKEENIINDMITKVDAPDKTVIVYGRNAADPSAEKKYKQLKNLGVPEVLIYPGGMFEWALLQDIYGQDEFPTTNKIVDPLRYKKT